MAAREANYYSRGRSRGHTLVELMIAAVLSLVLIGAAALLYRSARQAFAAAASAESLRDAGVTALVLLGHHLQMAGYVPADASATAAAARVRALFGCSGGRPVGDGAAAKCEPLASASDGVIVGYVGDPVSTWPSAVGEPTDCLGQSVGPAASRAPIFNRFYASFSESGEPALYCKGEFGGGQPVVSGVERLTLRYWMPGAASPVQASEIAPDRWDEVLAVDLCVLVRSASRAAREPYVDCSGRLVPSPDARARQAFWRHVAVRNRDAETHRP